MSFLQNIKSSIYNPSFYREIAMGNEHKPFRYFFKLSFLLALIFAVVVSFQVIPEIKKFINESKQKIEENYPKDLEVKIEKGVATTNAVEPYFVKFPETPVDINTEMPDVENILVIDTKTPFSLEKFKEHKTISLLTKDSIVSIDGDEKVTVTPLKTIPDFTVNYANITKWLSDTDKLNKIIAFAFPILILLGVFIAYVFKLIYLFFGALLVYIVAKIKKINLSYRKSYHVALYAVTLPTLLSAVAFFTGLKMFTFLPSILLIIAVWFNLKQETTPTVVLEQ